MTEKSDFVLELEISFKNVKICSKLLSSVPIYCKSMGKEQYL